MGGALWLLHVWLQHQHDARGCKRSKHGEPELYPDVIVERLVHQLHACVTKAPSARHADHGSQGEDQRRSTSLHVHRERIDQRCES